MSMQHLVELQVTPEGVWQMTSGLQTHAPLTHCLSGAQHCPSQHCWSAPQDKTQAPVVVLQI
jgi:hypothetical protein